MSHAAQITTGFRSPEKRPKNPQSRRWLWRLVRHFFHDAIVSEPRGEASIRDSRRASKAASKTHRDNGAPILRHACRRSDARKNNTTDAPDHRCHSSSRPLGACMFQAEASRGSSLPNVKDEPRARLAPEAAQQPKCQPCSWALAAGWALLFGPSPTHQSRAIARGR